MSRQQSVRLTVLKSLPPLPSGSVYIPSEPPISVGSWLESAALSMLAVTSLGCFLVWVLFV